MLWAVEEGADYIVAETFPAFGEAQLALEAIKQYGNGKGMRTGVIGYDAGLPSVVTLTGSNWTGTAPEQDCLVDGVRRDEACARLLAAGANVVGINCACGPVVGRRVSSCVVHNNCRE